MIEYFILKIYFPTVAVPVCVKKHGFWWNILTLRFPEYEWKTAYDIRNDFVTLKVYTSVYSQKQS